MEPPDEPSTPPTGRVPQWVIDERAAELIRAAAPARPGSSSGTDPWAPPPAGPRRPAPSWRPGRRWPAIVLAGLVTVAVITLGLRYQLNRPGTTSEPSPTAAAAPGGSATGAAASTPETSATSATSDVITDGRGGVLVDLPPPGRGEQPGPVGRPAPLNAPSDHYAFQQTRPTGEPVAWDPCREIHYVVRPDHAPPGADRVLREALAVVSRSTGLQFVADGATDEKPSLERDPYLPKRYPGHWAPVLIAWSTPAELPDLATGAMALGGNVVVESVDRPTVIVSGSVILNADVLDATMLSTAAGRRLAHASALHALATLVGLGTVEARGELMDLAPDFDNPVYDFGPGDRAGLAELGRGPCAPWL